MHNRHGMATPQLVTTPTDATSLWQAFCSGADPHSLAFTSSLQVDVAVARCAALYPPTTADPRFYTYVDRVKSDLQLWR